MKQLKLASINLSFFINDLDFQYVLEQKLSIYFTLRLLNFRYLLATMHIEKTLNERNIENSDEILMELSKPILSGIDANTFEIIKLAESEIDRVKNNEETVRAFDNINLEQNEQIRYMESVLGKRLGNVFEQLFIETLGNRSFDFNSVFGIPEECIFRTYKIYRSKTSRPSWW